MSSALATRLSIDSDPLAAVRWVTSWLNEAITHAEKLQVGSGKGHGPIDHFHQLRRLAAAGQSAPFRELAIELGAATTPSTLLATPPAGAIKTPRIPAPGPWTAALWEAGGTLWWQIMDLDFIRQLKDGTLDADAFANYIGQDAHYLAEYARALGQLGVKAPHLDDRISWFDDAQQCIVAEMELHRSVIGGDNPPEAPSPVTRAYTDFLTATVATDDYAVGAAAVLPCYWLYMEIGLELGPVADDHPFKAWIEEYSSEDFANSTAAAIARVEACMDAASPETRQRATRAYLVAARHELEFFDQAMRRNHTVK